MVTAWARRFADLYASIFALPQLAGFHYVLLKISLRGLGVLNYHDDRITGERHFITHLLPRLVDQDSPVFFDVGANRGAYSRQLARLFPSARILAFEPHPENFRTLASLDLANVDPYEMALGEKAGIAELFDHRDRDGSTNASLFREVISEIHRNKPVAHRVKVDTLDSIAENIGVDHIDFLKMDTEGNEFSILRGGQSLLGQGRIGVIQFEFNEMNTISHVLFCDFSRLLGRDYVFYRLLPRGLLQIPEVPLYSELFAYQNILAVPRGKVHLI